MGTKEPVSSSLSKVDVRQMIDQLEDAKRLLAAVGTEFPHLQHDVAHARSLLTGLVFSLEKPDQGKADAKVIGEDANA